MFENQTQQLKCPKQTHEESPILCFKFTDQTELMLQCIKCMLDDPDSNGKLELNQILKNHCSKIQNYPPFLEKKLQEKIQNNFAEFTPKKFEELKIQIQNQITDYFEEIQENFNESLNKKKKDIFIQLDEMFQVVNIFELYDDKPIKDAINKFISKEINKDDLFKIQLDQKTKFQTQKLNLDLNEFIEKTNNRFNDFKEQIDRHLNNFNQNLNNAQNFHIDNYGINNQFFKSYFNKQDIIIKNNRTIVFQNETISGSRQVYSQPLDKNRTYCFKIHIKIFKKQYLKLNFLLLGSEQTFQENYGQSTYEQRNFINFDTKICQQKEIDDLKQQQQQKNDVLQEKNQNDSSQIVEDSGQLQQQQQQEQKRDVSDNIPWEAICDITFNFKNEKFQISHDKKIIEQQQINKNKIKGELLFGIKLQNISLGQIAEINVIDFNFY